METFIITEEYLPFDVNILMKKSRHFDTKHSTSSPGRKVKPGLFLACIIIIVKSYFLMGVALMQV